MIQEGLLMHSLLFLLFAASILLLLDAYLVHGLRAALANKAIIHKKKFYILYWLFCVGMTAGLLCCIYVKMGVAARSAFMLVFFITQTAKLCFLPFMLIDDVRRLIIRLKRKKQTAPELPADKDEIQSLHIT